MKRLHLVLPLAAALLFTACNGGEEKASTDALGGYLDSAYVSKGYRAAMDSIRASSGISDADYKVLQGFMRQYRDSIQGHPTYRSLLGSAIGIKDMEDAVGMAVATMSASPVQKYMEYRFLLSFENKLQQPINKFRADIAWTNEAGKRVTSTPAFSVAGPLAPGAKVEGLRLEYAVYKPTGNELNDPKNQATRDTMEMLSEIVKRKDLGAFRLRIHDVQLGNGLRPAQYWLRPAEERMQLKDEPLPPAKKWPGLMDWAKANERWITELGPSNSPYSIMVSPVLTENVEASHGKLLVLDRVAKVQAFFDGKRIPRGNINANTAGKHLVLEEMVDFWGWPMELRIYQLN